MKPKIYPSKAYSKPTEMASELTLRGLFAKDAMKGLLSNHALIDTVNWEWIAEQSFIIADKMIELLNKK